jgi:hypothetical protein
MNRAILFLLLGLTAEFPGAGTSLAQSAPAATPNKVFAAPTPVPKPPSATAPKPALNSTNAPNQKTPEPEKTQIVAIFRGSGFFDEALAQKVRPALVKAFHLESDTRTGSTAGKPRTTDNPINRAADAGKTISP